MSAIRRAGALIASLIAGATTLAGCGGSAAVHQVLKVPGEYPTIQAAVDAARPGDLVLIAPGVYHEAVTSHIADLVIRGMDRNNVILDGQNNLTNGITLAAAGDAVENLTVRSYAVNGILFTLLDGYGNGPTLKGYRASYVTAYDNGLYGLYAFGAVDGLFDHDDASGQPDSGIYIGQCRPCNAVVEYTTAESNRVGFEAANTSGGLTVIDSRFDDNRAGVVVESDTTELLLPQVGATVAGNVVADNENPDTPTTATDQDVFGYGIAIGGGSEDKVVRNRVTGNTSVGIIVTDEAGYLPQNNTIENNALASNHLDLAYVESSGSGTAGGNCFTGNTFSTSAPSDIESVLACGSTGTVQSSFTGANAPEGADYTTIPRPPAQAGLTDPTGQPIQPAVDEPPPVDLADITLPSA